MKNISFSSAVKTLLTNGFVLALEDTWKDSNTKSVHRYNIYINPVHHVIAVINGLFEDQIFDFQMYYSWKPLSLESLNYILIVAEEPFCSDIKKVCSTNAESTLDSTSIYFTNIESSTFLFSWEFYSLILENGIFLSWEQRHSNICLIKPHEVKSFTYNILIDYDDNLSENDIYKDIKYQIDMIKSSKIATINYQRLTSIISNLNLSPANFGL